MSCAAIYLGQPLPDGSSDLPKARRAAVSLYSVLLRMGLACAFPVTGEAVVSYTAFPPLPAKSRRFISVALSRGLPLPDVIRHPAL